MAPHPAPRALTTDSWRPARRRGIIEGMNRARTERGRTAPITRGRPALTRSLGASLPALGVVLLVACGKSSESTVLQGDDLKVTPDTTFDPNEIVDPGSFQDTLTFDAVAIQRFLARTPYKHPSFLESYQSNGVSAAQAIYRAASIHGINPMVLLVRAEMDQGLVGSEDYPFPPSRVEYVFNCGCPGVGMKCDPALAGFDRQADCLARKLRASLDEIRDHGVTAGNWGPGQEGVTLDGKHVTPADPSTAALYQYTPVVGEGSKGNWLFWNIWQNYALFLQYDGPIGPPSGQGSWIGDGCASDATCVAPGSFCATNFPGGMCTAACTADDCPADPDKPQSFCAEFGSNKGGYCLPVCNPGVPGTCRAGYDCKPVFVHGTQDTENACIKAQ